ncbi:formate dehydrogenase accessory protein fdhd [Bacillus sp. OxB-1]|uniref:formate dehydrogenase accessory sulfurtransferase FdhD n=1 Tax=Bacillus sp. (strain OxB-1) TaxID=98228 RepID=UPI000581EA35|nr:formate dehydrogenase accessory sulfurtransferase FdhD [Bacillus sp. OxB-1]BAQ11051.1 formate dehydrogenase accessory protein fdhd [Bacillus sp. OxB-1]
MNLAEKRTVLQFANGSFTQREDLIVAEHPVTIRINSKEFMTIVCSPDHIEEMVIGFLASEGIIPKYEQIKDLRVDEGAGIVHIETDTMYPYYEQLLNKRFVNSCCGMSRPGFIFAHDALTAKKMTGTNIELSPAQCFSLMEEMERSADLFHQTGGVHNAAIGTPAKLILTRMDIGRHNALDKLYGHCLKHQINVRDKAIVFSGRISSEILLKVAKIGCEVILSKSAPSARALVLAEELGITTVGFIRGQTFNIYTHPERIVLTEENN